MSAPRDRPARSTRWPSTTTHSLSDAPSASITSYSKRPAKRSYHRLLRRISVPENSTHRRHRVLGPFKVWPQAAIDYAREEGEVDPDDEDPDHWLAVWCEGSQTAYGDMEDFIETFSDRDRADRLSIVISGRGAFRRFKDVLGRWA